MEWSAQSARPSGCIIPIGHRGREGRSLNELVTRVASVAIGGHYTPLVAVSRCELRYCYDGIMGCGPRDLMLLGLLRAHARVAYDLIGP
jgi:hypothetical protein